MAHTPGPWFVSLNYGHMTGVRAGDAATGRHVAATWCQTSQPKSAVAHSKQVEQNEANARLIAAAPETAAERDKLKTINAELLAALEAILPWIPVTTASEGGTAKFSENVRAADMVRAAILAAKGA